MFTKNKNLNLKREINGKINFCFRFIDYDFKKIETIDEEKLSYLLEVLI